MRSDPIRSPPGLNMGHDFALEPCQIGKGRQHHEKQDDDLRQDNDEKRMPGGQFVHGRASTSTSSSAASGRERIIVQYWVRLPLVNRVSFGEKMAPAGTSNFELPFAEETGEVRSASPSSSVGMVRV